MREVLPLHKCIFQGHNLTINDCAAAMKYDLRTSTYILISTHSATDSADATGVWQGWFAMTTICACDLIALELSSLQCAPFDIRVISITSGKKS